MRPLIPFLLLAACADPMGRTELQALPAPTAQLQTATFALG
jgi:hypothetical protein